MSGHHHRGTPLIRLLARLGWDGGPHSWVVPCQDADGRRARLLIGLSPPGVTITPAAEGPLHLTALQVGRLRGAAREAIGIGVLLADSAYATDPGPGA
ncbi:MAG TPA: hypothetical protein VFO16_10940 [Pseudonocardiaceae bacterium]|nr:hypothetical protein [Pseudonocardiaceae bacterium]